MTDKMSDEQINKIAQAIAAKIGEPGGPAILGCGSASSSSGYDCGQHTCNGTSYECGGAARHRCGYYNCYADSFSCGIGFLCAYSFYCSNEYSGG